VANGTRTRDHRDHNPGLYQLSYRHRARGMVPGRQPSGVSSRCSSTAGIDAKTAAGALLDVLSRNRGDVLIAAHPDVTVKPPHREADSVVPEGATARKRVLAVRVDQRDTP
jgi:hypothetical protein